MSKFKTVTHFIAVGLAAGVGWAISPQGQAFLGPKWGSVVALLAAAATAAGVYHNPKEPRPLGN